MIYSSLINNSANGDVEPARTNKNNRFFFLYDCKISRMVAISAGGPSILCDGQNIPWHSKWNHNHKHCKKQFAFGADLVCS